MVNKRGQAQAGGAGRVFWIILGIIAVLLVAGWLFGLSPKASLDKLNDYKDSSLREIGKDSNPTSFGDIFSARFSYLDYVFGKVPEYLIDRTSDVSAAIIVIGIWLLFLLTFADIITLFSTFHKGIAWVAAALLTIIASNLKFISWISITALFVTAGFGALSVIVSLIGVFVLFLLFNWGTQSARTWVITRKNDEMTWRAGTGSRRAAAAISGLREIQRAQNAAGQGD